MTVPHEVKIVRHAAYINDDGTHPGGSSDLDGIVAASAGQDIADALANAAAPDAGNPFATMADVGGGGGGGGATEFITGDSKDFQGGIGDWAGDPTFSLEPSFPWLSWQTNALKAVFSDDGDVATLPIVGTFAAGKVYQAAVVIKSPSAVQQNCGFFVYFGDQGAGDFNADGYASVAGFGDQRVVVMQWVPTAARTAASITLVRDVADVSPTDDVAILIGYTRAIAPADPTDLGLFMLAQHNSTFDLAAHVAGFLYGYDAAIQFNDSSGLALSNRVQDTGAPGFISLGASSVNGGVRIQGKNIEINAGFGQETTVKFPELAADPSSPSENFTYYNTTSHKLRTYDGTSWHDLW